MHEGISKLLETFSKRERTVMIAEASEILREEAKFRYPTLQYHQDRIARLKDFLGWSDRRTRSVYNGEDGVSLRGAEALRIEELKLAQKARLRRQEEIANGEGYKALAARFAAMEAELATLRAAIAGETLANEGAENRGSSGDAHRSRAGAHSRRASDRP